MTQITHHQASAVRGFAQRPQAGQLRIRPTLRGRGFVVGVVDANGPETVGFTRGDRVAWRDQGGELEQLLLLDHRDVLGVPGWISDEQVVSYLGPGLIARALLRASRPVHRGEGVMVQSSDPVVADAVGAWAASMGARIVDDGAALVLSYAPAGRRRPSSHGRLAQAAVEVFQAIRSGVFEQVPLARSARAGRGARVATAVDAA
ncbi:hypothetical protein [Homoserinibacter sp. YIM 151385]|uniref:hypothetical protein n=1 Tax=Homoserinibacter sp. YIM 151385 TaxID=2985506 RepID=UPI0022F13AC2|nr:hypothetical protein [Homoserinibacter sp. YIM 151385]WBU38392.1 hypothetical protein OF852_02065 [Homoserinibacter sp. YIM 151385]